MKKGVCMQEENHSVPLKEQSPLSLAFLGDGVFELLVRRHLVETTKLKPAALHKKAVQFVSAKRQFIILEKLQEFLTEQEKDIVRRGKNSSKATVAKHATSEEYRASTALEALFGYLYLLGSEKRITELFEIIWEFAE